MYDPIIGRWGTLDPMAENNYSNTPYKYSNNNPENYIDPDGREETDENGNTPTGWDKYGQPIYDPATYYNPGYPNGMSSYYAIFRL